jgi:hypothetical protein
MRFRRPSPSMVVSIVALVMATSGTAVAAVKFARNAGAVDHKSAVSAAVSRNHAAGRLVATRAKSPGRGQLPNRFVAHVPFTTTFSRAVDVVNNASGGLAALNGSRLGVLFTSCSDQNNNPSTEDPTQTIRFQNTRPITINVARTIGSATPQVAPLQPGAQRIFTINGSNTFQIHAESHGVDVVYTGQVRQDGFGTSSARCFIGGTAETSVP